MNSASLSRQQRRMLERHSLGVDLVTASDRRWFEEHPGRQFRIRRMAPAEIGSALAVSGKLKPVPAGAARFTLVRKLSPTCRMRIFIYGPAHKSGQETGEAVAAALWDQHADRNAAVLQRQFAIAAIVSDHDAGDQAFEGGAA